jgi:hypothetical protein
MSIFSERCALRNWSSKEQWKIRESWLAIAIAAF